MIFKIKPVPKIINFQPFVKIDLKHSPAVQKMTTEEDELNYDADQEMSDFDAFSSAEKSSVSTFTIFCGLKTIFTAVFAGFIK